MNAVKIYRELETYKMVREMSQSVFDITKHFPTEEKYSLTDQIRRSSRAVGAMIAEAWGRRRYKNVFICKLDEALGEVTETQSWLDSALDCGYISPAKFTELNNCYQLIGGKLSRMIDRADDFCKFAPSTDYRSLVKESEEIIGN